MKKTNHWLWTGMMLLFVALLMAGCSSEGGGDGGGETNEPGPPAEIIFKAFNSIVPINGVITITASITDIDDRKVADGTSVTMTDAQGLVLITPASQVTVDGKATFVVTGQVAGIANLICQAGGAIFPISITIVDTAPTIVLSADDTTILVGQVVEISATVMESDGTLVADDTEITFDLSDDQLAELDETTALTTNGVATVYLTARETGTVVVGATYGAGTGTLEMTIQEQGSVEPANIAITASSGTVLMGAAATITATVTGTGGQAVSDGTSVTFEVDTDAGSVSPVSGVTQDGVVTTTFFGEKFGLATITATAGSAIATTTINVTANIVYLSITTSKTQVKTDNNDFATITAIALDQNRVPVEFVPITFSASAGQLSAFKVDTDENGEAQITFKSGAYDKENQTVTITASAPPNVRASIPVQLTGTTISLAIDNTSLQSGGGAGSSTTMTITVKDGGGVAIFDTDVAISQASDGSASVLLKEEGSGGTGTSSLNVTTDVTGKAFVTVIGNNAGTEPVVLTVSGLGDSATQNIIVSGLPFELLKEISAGPADVFAFIDSNPDTITRSDGGSFINEGFAAGDAITVTGSAGAVNDGGYTIASVQTGVLTLIAGDTLTDEVKGATVTIRLAATDYISANSMIYAATSSVVYLGVRSPDGHNVRVSTSVGTVDDGVTNAAVITASPNTLPPNQGIADFVLRTPASAGIATITVEDVTDTSINDSIKVAIAAPSSAAANIRIQASPTVIPASTGGVINVSSLLITVTNASGEVVFGAPVSVKMVDATRPAGGEYIAPNLVYTDVSGQAESTFYSGTLVSTSTGVQITASLVGGAASDTIAVVIGGDASSVSIGAPTEFQAFNESVYRKPMTVLVADSNGNPVNGATVNLSVWPLGYYTGGIGTNGPVYCCNNYYPNEDTNRNELLDGTEDIGPNPGQYNAGDCSPCPCLVNGTGNGVLDPAKSTAGTVPATVITDENGVAEFDFFQQKVYSVWTKVEIKASVVVYGTETIAVLRYGPNWLENEAKNLPSSPWGDCWDLCGVAWTCP